jgi:hypothetical protein
LAGEESDWSWHKWCFWWSHLAKPHRQVKRIAKGFSPDGSTSVETFEDDLNILQRFLKPWHREMRPQK